MAQTEADDDDTFPDGTILVDRSGVGACFGCGPANEGGLRLRFRHRDGGGVETRLTPDLRFQGVDGILHGGIQATVLDEVTGVAAQLSLPPEPAGSPRPAMVTAELSLRFRRPVPMDGDVVAVARVVRVDGPDVWVHGAIVGPDGRELTTAEARWRLPRQDSVTAG